LKDAHGRLQIVTGKGGVGKSAVTAALAVDAQRHGLKVLAIDMTGGSGLAGHFSVAKLNFRPMEIRPGLSALSVDRSQALIEYLQTQIGVPGLATFGPFARAFDALASTAPGIREVITIGKVLWEVKKGSWDLVVADAPPLGQIPGFLRAPRTVRELVPGGRVRHQAEWMEEMLLEAAQLIMVTLAEELPTVESEEALDWLGSANLTPAPMVVTNRVLTPLATTAVGRGVAAQAARHHRALSAEQEVWLQRLPADRRLPFLFGLLTPGEVAARLADAWDENK
jgi:anion-transporting  ArsA/GET3 family ATPase